MWKRARKIDSAASTAVSASSGSAGRGGGRGRGRGGIKRRAADQPDGQPTPKKSARLMDDIQLLETGDMAPAPSKGLLASAAEVDSPVEGTPGDEDSVPASPEPLNLFNGVSSSAYNRAQGKLSAREKSPPLPKNIAEADEYGVRIYNQRLTMREKATNSRIIAPHVFRFNDWETGFRDSSNDSSKGHTRTKRGKYLDTPNSNGMHFDHWCNGYDYSSTNPSDFDENLVRKHGVHPKYGIFLPTSTNDNEAPDPCVMPGKPKVFIANPSGRISHASRSFMTTINQRRVEDAPFRLKLSTSMRRFCKIADIEAEDLSISEYLPTEEEMRSKSLGTAQQELASRPSDEIPEADVESEKVPTPRESTPKPESLRAALSAVSYAALMLEAEDANRAAPPPPPKPKPAARYDAIRDIFNDVKPAAPPPVEDTRKGLGLSVLAELCNVAPRPPTPERPALQPASSAVAESSVRTGAPPHEHRIPLSVDTRTSRPASQRDMALGPSTSLGLYGPTSSVLGAGSEKARYPSPRDSISTYGAQTSHDYKTHPPPSVHDLGAYAPQSAYPTTDSRDNPMSSSRAYESPYSHRRLSGYMPDVPPYNRPYWAAQPPPPPPSSSVGPTYPAPPLPPQQSRMPFSQNASAEPLPPLRPPRSRNSLQDDSLLDPSLRSSASTGAGGYYSAGPSRPFHTSRPYPSSEGQSSLRLTSVERMAPGMQLGAPGSGQHPPQRSARSPVLAPGPSSGYMASPPPQSYPPTNPMLSPTFTNPPLMSSQMGQLGQLGPSAQSPPGTPQGPPSSIRRHQSTPSGSSDAGSAKYRKLQPAPIPAHRTWSSKQELKTIPYDHKETGSVAALPQSGPTQIRGWNVNSHKKRSKSDKQADQGSERDESR